MNLHIDNNPVVFVTRKYRINLNDDCTIINYLTLSSKRYPTERIFKT